MEFPKNILVIKYLASYKNSEGPDYLPICVTSVENAEASFWEKEYELFEIRENGDLRLFKELGVE